MENNKGHRGEGIEQEGGRGKTKRKSLARKKKKPKPKRWLTNRPEQSP